MANGERASDVALHFSGREEVRANSFRRVWTQELNDVFADVAAYYDRANYVASLGLWYVFRNSFLATITLQSGQNQLDVCAGTNAVGIAMLRKQPDLNVFAIDRSAAMQDVGRQRAAREGLHIESIIGDAHKLPFPDNHFDVVTLQWASRHLRVVELYQDYLRVSLSVTAVLFQSGATVRNYKQYFIDALSLFYSAEELSQLLRHLGYENVSSKTLLGGMVGIHKAMKP
jgi:demethylmenaquinone methyltransferase/2-methoxy-6-polyprenyl-1,4-benzoquinol methylase